jgi:glycosyltransferase involved in cell wall biosynthesis
MAPSRKPRLAIVANGPSPYRVHQHERIAREMAGEVELWSLFFYEHNWQPWTRPLPPEIRPVVFGPGEAIQEKNDRGGWLRQWGKAGRVIDWLKVHEIDAVITTGYNDPGLMRLIRWCHSHGLPNFMFGDANLHGDRARGLKKALKKQYVGWVVRRLTGLMPCGLYGRQFFEAYGGADKPWFYMPHEPDYAKIFRVTPDQRAAAMAKFGIRPDRRYFIYSGRLVGVKRVDTLIDAFAKLAEQRPDWDLLIVGGGSLEAELRARVPQHLASRVVWTGFIDDADELARLYTCGHVFILPSSYEPWAVVVCEATAAGMPVVASRVVGAAGELCREGTNGRLFKPGDVAELAEALLDVTESSERLAQLSAGSLQVLDDWRRRGDPVQGVRLALAHVGLLPPPPPVEPDPPTPQHRPAYT